jgi:hypothetical protein
MNPVRMESLLDDLGVVRHPCDLDALVFFSQYPRALLTREQLGAFVGYNLKQIVKSLDALIDAGLLERSQNPNHPAELYVLVFDGPRGDSLSSLVKIASTSRGRRQLLQVLKTESPEAHDSRVTTVLPRRSPARGAKR